MPQHPGMSEELEEGWFTAVPYREPGRVIELRRRYQVRIKRSLAILIRATEKGGGLDLSRILRVVDSLDDHRRFSSRLHWIAVRVESSYAQRDVNGLRDALVDLSRLDSTHSYSDEFCIDSIGSQLHDGRVEEMLRTQDSVSQAYGASPRTIPLNDHAIVEHVPKVQLALELVASVAPAIEHEIRTYISRVALFEGIVVTGISSIMTFGTIYLRLPRPPEHPLPFFVEHLTHEAAHHHLHALMGFDRLVANPMSDLARAPIRKDQRPIYGIFHATFVLSRMVRVLSALEAKDPLLFGPWADKARRQFLDGRSTLKEKAILTPMGQRVADSLMVAGTA